MKTGGREGRDDRDGTERDDTTNRGMRGMTIKGGEEKATKGG